MLETFMQHPEHPAAVYGETQMLWATNSKNQLGKKLKELNNPSSKLGARRVSLQTRTLGVSTVFGQT